MTWNRENFSFQTQIQKRLNYLTEFKEIIFSLNILVSIDTQGNEI